MAGTRDQCEPTSSANPNLSTVYSCGTHGICSPRYISPPPTVYAYGIYLGLYRGCIPWATIIYRGCIPWIPLQMFPTVYNISWGPGIYRGEHVVHGISRTIQIYTVERIYAVDNTVYAVGTIQYILWIMYMPWTTVIFRGAKSIYTVVYIGVYRGQYDIYCG